MSLLSKLLKRNNQEFVKGDVCIYIQFLNEKTDLKKDSYVVAGVYNADGTAFKNVLTGEVFQIAKEDIDSIVVGEKHYGKLDNNAYTAFKRGVSGLIEIHVMCYEKHCSLKQGFIEGCMLEPFYINPDYEKGMKNILKYLQKENDERVSLDELQKVAKAINKIVYKNHKIRYNNLHHSLHNQSLRESYNDF